MEKVIAVFKRLLKGLIAGGVAAMALVPLVLPNTWSGFLPTFNTLGIAFAFGGLTGLILALQKWANWKE